MRCLHCGREAGNSEYCPWCGNKVRKYSGPTVLIDEENKEGNEDMKVWLILLTIFTAGIFVLELIQTALLFV